MTNKNEFLKVASAVDGAYDDFIFGTYFEAKQEGILNEVLSFMKGNANASTDDVCEFLSQLEGNAKAYSVAPSIQLQVA